ncbi:MAG: methyl-accepting chemotaxis protein [Promethearchaeota archaeon]
MEKSNKKLKSVEEIIHYAKSTEKSSKRMALIIIAGLVIYGAITIIMVNAINTNQNRIVDQDFAIADSDMEAKFNLVASRDAMGEYQAQTYSNLAEIETEFKGFLTTFSENYDLLVNLDLTAEMQTLTSAISNDFSIYNETCYSFMNYYKSELSNLALQESFMEAVDTNASVVNDILDELQANTTILSNTTLSTAIYNMTKNVIHMMDFGAEMLAFEDEGIKNEYLAAKTDYLSAKAILIANGTFTTQMSALSASDSLFFTNSESMMDARISQFTAEANRRAKMDELDAKSGDILSSFADLELLVDVIIEQSLKTSRTLFILTLSLTIAIAAMISLLLFYNTRKTSKALENLGVDFGTASSALDEKLGYIESVMQALPVGIVGVDTDFKILSINKTLANMTGFDPERDLGKYCYDKFDTKLCHTDKCPVTKAKKTKEVTESVDIDFDEKIFEIQGAPILDQEGEFLGGLEIMNDVTKNRGLENEVTRIAIEVNTMAEQISESAGQINLSVQEITNGSQEMARGTQEQATSLNDISVSVMNVQKLSQDVVDNSNLVAKISNEGQKQALDGAKMNDEMITKMKQINVNANSVSEVMSELEEKSKAINKIVDMISGIATETNLLALNAAIEAARAGDAGKGFAVVAEQVRKLAEDSKQATDQIAELIKAIRDRINIAVKSTDATSSAILDGNQTLDKMKIQLEGLFQAILETDEKVKISSKGSEDENAHIEEIAKNIEQINSVVEETSSTSEELSSSTEEIASTLEELSAGAEELSTLSQNLKDQLAK